MLLLLLVLTLTNAQPGGAPCQECYRRERGECRRIPGCTKLQRGKDDCVKKGVPSKFGTVNGDYCALPGGQYRCGSGGVLCCNTGFKPKSNGNSFYCPGGPKKLSTDAPSVSCDLQPKKVCTGKREEYLDDTAGESGHMNPGRCQEICEKHEAEGCCMYEVDHLRCFIVKSGGKLKTDNSVKREYTSLGYHGVNYNEIPQRHAGFCKKKAAEKAVGTGCDASCMKFAAEWIGDGVCDRDTCGQCSGWTTNGVFDGGDCGTGQLTSEAEVGASCAGTSLKLGTTSDNIGGTVPLFACQGIGLEMTIPLSVQNGDVYVCCVPRSASKKALAMAEVTPESGNWVVYGLALFGFGVMAYGAFAHFCKKEVETHIEF